MNIRRILTLATLACLIAGAVGVLGAKPPGNTVVVSTLNNTGDVVSGTNYRLQSDGNGSYFNGVSSVTSIIQGVGDWEMNTSSSATRSVLVDFREPGPGSSTSSAPFDWQYVKARYISKCSTIQSGGYLSMTPGAPVNCPLHAVFDYNGSTYKLTMNPLNDGATSFAQASCKGVDGAGKCNNWSVVPVTQADTSARSTAVLLRDTRVRNKTVTTNLGYFYMTFQIDLAKP